MRFFPKNTVFFVGVVVGVAAASLVFPAHPTPVFSATAAEEAIAKREAELRKELAKTEAEIAQWTVVLNQKRQETGSFKRDAEILAAKIEQAKLVIKAKNLAIQTLGKDIGAKEQTIAQLNERINRGKDSLGQLIRKTNEMDSFSVAEAALSNKDISEFFADVDSYGSIQQSLEDLFADIRNTKALTEAEKAALGAKRDQETNAKVAIETEKRSVEKTEAEKRELLRISQNQEKTYEQTLKEKQKKAAEIRTALFALRDSAAIPFGTALIYANEVSEKTGIRPAFLLAILTQESDLGKNVGSCIVKDITTGNGVGKNTGTPFQQIMKAPRDTAPFQNIMDRLGRDWASTPVSCPPAQTYYVGRGFGGGMGPSQFIPSTWELFKQGIGTALGISPEKADPWNPEHAFMATGIYMRDLGAGSGTWTAERNAACKYYSGEACIPGRKPANAPYGDQVMIKAQTIQETMIDPLEGL